MAYDKEAPARALETQVQQRRPTAIDLFCGIGGMSLGFEQAGFEVIVGVEWDPLLAAVHKFNHPKTRTICLDVASLVGTARKTLQIDDTHLDVVFGGPPCQGFSMIGRRRVDDERNDLVEAFLKVAVELQPRYIVMENVEGILQSAMSRHIERAKLLLRAARYEFLEPARVDASEYGVPQRRRRVFLVAWRIGERPFVWPTKTHGKAGSNLKPFVTVKDAIGDIGAVTRKTKSEYAQRLGPRQQSGLAALRRGFPVGLTGLEGTSHSAETVKRFAATQQGKEESVSRYTRLSWNGVCHTIRAGTGPDRGSFMSARPIHPSEPRVITVREAARLHGFPDWYQFHHTKWHAFRGIGNSVPPPLGQAIGGQIVASLDLQPPIPSPISLGHAALLQLDRSGAAKEFSVNPNALPTRQTSGRKTTKPASHDT